MFSLSSAFGLVHVALSVVAMASGLVVVLGLLASRRLDRWTALYLASAVTTTVTGFALGSSFGVPQYLGVAESIALLLAIVARYPFHLAGAWRPVYAVATVAGLHILVFFTVGEAFIRIPGLNAMAPTLTEAPFVIVQSVVLALFVALAVAAAMRFRHEHVATPQPR